MRSHTSCRPARRRQGASDPGAKHLCLAKSDQDRGGSLWSVSSAGRAVGFYPTGRGFDSSTLCPCDPCGRAPSQPVWGMSSYGRAPGSDPEGWRFEPSMSRTPKYANRNSGLLQVQVCAGSSPAFGIAIARGAKVARRAVACVVAAVGAQLTLIASKRTGGTSPPVHHRPVCRGHPDHHLHCKPAREPAASTFIEQAACSRGHGQSGPSWHLVMFLRGFPLRGPGRAWEPAKTTPRCWPPPARA